MLPEWAMPVALGMKTVECRTWGTDYRGDVLVCASNRPLDGCIHGHALCVATLERVEPFEPRHCEPALMEDDDVPDNCFAWVLSNARMVEPFKVKGKLRLFDVPDELVHVLGRATPQLVEKYYIPLVHRAKRNSYADDIWRGVYEDLGWL